MTVGGVGESRKIVKQTDSGFRVDAQADPGGPSSPDSPLHVRPLRMIFVMGGNSRAGSWQKALILLRSAFLPVQLSQSKSIHDHWKNHSLD